MYGEKDDAPHGANGLILEAKNLQFKTKGSSNGPMMIKFREDHQVVFMQSLHVLEIIIKKMAWNLYRAQ